jgi:hypothetical protein
MHRSGTSALAGVLHSIGVSMGKNLLEAGEINPKGFFENRNVYYFNELSLLPSLSTSAFDLKFSQAKFEEKNWDEKLFLKAKNIIENDYMDLQLFGLKDPRISILVPFWSDVLESLDVEPYYAIIVRSPFEVMTSLRKIYDITEDEGYLIWLNYYLSIFQHTSGRSRYIVLFDDLFKNTDKVINDILTFLDIECNVVTRDKASRFVDGSLRHNRRHNEIRTEGASCIANKMYEQLISLCGNEGGVRSMEAFPDIKKQYEKILNDGQVVEQNLRGELRRVSADREVLFHTAEKRLCDVREQEDWCLDEISRVGKERDELFNVAEERLREIQSLVKRYDDLYEVSESRNSEIHTLVRKIDSISDKLTEVSMQKSICEMNLDEIKQCLGYRFLKKFKAIK